MTTATASTRQLNKRYFDMMMARLSTMQRQGQRLDPNIEEHRAILQCCREAIAELEGRPTLTWQEKDDLRKAHLAIEDKGSAPFLSSGSFGDTAAPAPAAVSAEAPVGAAGMIDCPACHGTGKVEKPVHCDAWLTDKPCQCNPPCIFETDWDEERDGERPF